MAALLSPFAFLVVAAADDPPGAAVVLAAGLGFAALTVLALQVVMPSRARAFTAPFGADVLVRFHRGMGVVALVLVVAHVVVLVAGDLDRAALLNPLDAPWRARFGLAAVLALALLVLSSVRRTALGLRYEQWRGLHVVLGVVVLAASFAHVLGVSRFVGEAPLRWASLLFVLAALGAVFALRVARPFAASGRPYRLAEVRRERGGAATLVLAADGHPGLRFAPGQFAWLKLARTPYSLTEHPFSLSSSAARPDRPELTIKAVGDFTRGVAELQPGERLLLDGPHGSFRPAIPDAPYLLVAGGIGITPIMSLLRTLADAGDRRHLVLLYASRDWEGVTFREALEELRGRLHLDVHHVLSRPPEGWTGASGRIDAGLLERLAPDDVAGWNVLVCGPPPMTAATADALDALGVPRGQVHVEAFAGA